MRPLASVSGTRCTRWTTAFKLEHTEGRRPVDAEDDFLEAADARFTHRYYLRLPALAFREARVHAEEVRREKRGLVSARAAADFYNDAFFRRSYPSGEAEYESPRSSSGTRASSSASSSFASSRISSSSPSAISFASAMPVKHLLVLGEGVDYRRQLDVLFCRAAASRAGR